MNERTTTAIATVARTERSLAAADDQEKAAREMLTGAEMFRRSCYDAVATAKRELWSAIQSDESL